MGTIFTMKRCSSHRWCPAQSWQNIKEACIWGEDQRLSPPWAWETHADRDLTSSIKPLRTRLAVVSPGCTCTTQSRAWQHGHRGVGRVQAQMSKGMGCVCCRCCCWSHAALRTATHPCTDEDDPPSGQGHPRLRYGLHRDPMAGLVPNGLAIATRCRVVQGQKVAYVAGRGDAQLQHTHAHKRQSPHCCG